MGAEEPRRRRPRAESAGKPRGMGEWVFMARKSCTAPFLALKPNPSRLFLSAGRGDYPKGGCVPGLVRCPRSLYAFHKQHHQQPQDKQRNDAVLRHPDSAPAFEKQFHGSKFLQNRHHATTLWCYKIILWAPTHCFPNRALSTSKSQSSIRWTALWHDGQSIRKSSSSVTLPSSDLDKGIR